MINSILILDDDPLSLDAARLVVKSKLTAQIETTRHPTQSIQIATAKSFDAVLMDVSINYRGNPFGGLDVYRALAGRYGSSALLAYSQYIDDHVLERFGLPINFIEKGADANWPDRLADRVLSMRRKQTCFVAMPYLPELNGLYASIKAAIGKAGYECVRLDERVFTTSIVDKMFEEIENSRFVVFVATGKNPNVFFEAGYAVSLKKETITLVDQLGDLPFDVKVRNTIVYGEDMAALESKLSTVLENLTRS